MLHFSFNEIFSCNLQHVFDTSWAIWNGQEGFILGIAVKLFSLISLYFLIFGLNLYN